MSERRQAKEPQPTGEIHLRQMAQVQLADQTRTLEIAITLAVGADEAVISRAVETATAGMHGLTEQLDQHIAALRDAAGSVIPASLAAPALAAPANESAPEPVAAPATVEAPTAPVSNDATSMTMAGFLKAARELGYQPTDLPQTLGIETLTGIDFAEALGRLRAMHAAKPAPRGFAEEIGPYDAAEAVAEAEMSANEDDLDEPDFGPAPDDGGDGVFTASQPSDTEAPAIAAARERDAAQRRLKSLRSIRALGAVATQEQRVALQNLVIGPLGREKAQELIIAIWNPPMGEKLNAARTRALVEWAKEVDNFEQAAEELVDVARQPATQEA